MMISSGAKAIRPLGPVPCAIHKKVASEDIMDYSATSSFDPTVPGLYPAGLQVVDAPSASAEALRHSARRRKPALLGRRVEPAPVPDCFRVDPLRCELATQRRIP